MIAIKAFFSEPFFWLDCIKMNIKMKTIMVIYASNHQLFLFPSQIDDHYRRKSRFAKKFVKAKVKRFRLVWIVSLLTYDCLLVSKFPHKILRHTMIWLMLGKEVFSPMLTLLLPMMRRILHQTLWKVTCPHQGRWEIWATIHRTLQSEVGSGFLRFIL